MDKYETEVLFEHTRTLQQDRVVYKPSRKEKEYAWYRKRDRSSSPAAWRSVADEAIEGATEDVDDATESRSTTQFSSIASSARPPAAGRTAKPEGPFVGLEGLHVIEGGQIADGDGNVVGEVTTESKEKLERLIGLPVDEDGNVVDRWANLKGHSKLPGSPESGILNGSDVESSEEGLDEAGEVYREAREATEEDVADDATEKACQIFESADDAGEGEEEAAEAPQLGVLPEDLPIDFSVLSGLGVNEDGFVYDNGGITIGQLTEGSAEDLAGYPIGDNGEVLDEDGDLVGRVELLPNEIKRQLRETREQGTELPEGADEYRDWAADAVEALLRRWTTLPANPQAMAA